jgi:hypothetical protein
LAENGAVIPEQAVQPVDNGTPSGDKTVKARKSKGLKPGPGAAVSRFSWMKEIVTSLLAVSIAAVALILLMLTFIDAGKTGSSADLFGREKDVLQFVLPFLGTVLGYYFGRVPAERRAESAEQSASGAQQHAESLQQSTVRAEAERATAQQQAQQLSADTRATLGRMRAALTGTPRATLGGGQPGATADVQGALAELNALEVRLNR